jgi:hypothetical protein
MSVTKEATYVREIPTPNGIIKIRSTHPISDAAMETYKKQYGDGSSLKPKQKEEGPLPVKIGESGSLKEGLSDILSEGKKYFKEGFHGVGGAQIGGDVMQPEKKTDTPVSDAINSVFERGLTFGTSKWAEKNRKKTDEYIQNHQAVSGLADAAGSILPGILGGKVISTGLKAIMPTAKVSPLLKATIEGAAYGGGRSAVDEAGEGKEGALGRVLINAGTGGVVGGGMHLLGKGAKAAVNRLDPIAAKNNAGIWGARTKSANALKAQTSEGLLDKTVRQGKSLTDTADRHAVRLAEQIGQDTNAHRAVDLMGNKPAGNGGAYTNNTKNFLSRARNTLINEGDLKTTPIPMSARGVAKTTYKKLSKGAKKLTGGAFTPEDLVKIIKQNPGMQRKILESGMNKGAQVVSPSKSIAKVLQALGRSTVSEEF